MLAETRYEHIMIDTAGSYHSATMKVIELVLPHLAYGWSAEELRFQFPTLSLGQIHSALAYYWDRRSELDADIERRLKSMDALRTLLGEPPLVTKLKLAGLI